MSGCTSELYTPEHAEWGFANRLVLVVHRCRVAGTLLMGTTVTTVTCGEKHGRNVGTVRHWLTHHTIRCVGYCCTPRGVLPPQTVTSSQHVVQIARPLLPAHYMHDPHRLTSRSSTDSPTTDNHGSYAAIAGDDATTTDVEQGVTESSTHVGPLQPPSTDDDDDGDAPLSEQASLAKSGSLGRIASTEQGGGPVCLICLDPLTTEDYDKGEAIQLQCKCRGDLAMRHKTCAARWAGHKGDNVCDICKEPIHNLPEPIVPERDSDDEEGTGVMGMPGVL